MKYLLLLTLAIPVNAAEKDTVYCNESICQMSLLTFSKLQARMQYLESSLLIKFQCI